MTITMPIDELDITDVDLSDPSFVADPSSQPHRNNKNSATLCSWPRALSNPINGGTTPRQCSTHLGLTNMTLNDRSNGIKSSTYSYLKFRNIFFFPKLSGHRFYFFRRFKKSKHNTSETDLYTADTFTYDLETEPCTETPEEPDNSDLTPPHLLETSKGSRNQRRTLNRKPIMASSNISSGGLRKPSDYQSARHQSSKVEQYNTGSILPSTGADRLVSNVQDYCNPNLSRSHMRTDNTLKSSGTTGTDIFSAGIRPPEVLHGLRKAGQISIYRKLEKEQRMLEMEKSTCDKTPPIEKNRVYGRRRGNLKVPLYEMDLADISISNYHIENTSDKGKHVNVLVEKVEHKKQESLKRMFRKLKIS